MTEDKDKIEEEMIIEIKMDDDMMVENNGIMKQTTTSIIILLLLSIMLAMHDDEITRLRNLREHRKGL